MTDPWAGTEFRYVVRSCRPVTPVVAEIWLEPAAEAMDFRPGQYLLLSDIDGRIPPRSYSMANAPREDGAVSLLVTAVAGGPTSTWARGLSAGDAVSIEGPFGVFVTDDADVGPLLLLGAGSGLAPLRALIEAAVAGGRDVTLLLSCRGAAHLIDDDRWRGLASRTDRFDYAVTMTREPGAQWHEHLDVLLPRRFDCLAGWDVFAAGPPGFVRGCAGAAAKLGATADRIRTEEFFAPTGTVSP